jgi:hypothetical protein
VETVLGSITGTRVAVRSTHNARYRHVDARWIEQGC